MSSIQFKSYFNILFTSKLAGEEGAEIPFQVRNCQFKLFTYGDQQDYE